jgi:hypothetical protein
MKLMTPCPQCGSKVELTSFLNAEMRGANVATNFFRRGLCMSHYRVTGPNQNNEIQ